MIFKWQSERSGPPLPRRHDGELVRHATVETATAPTILRRRYLWDYPREWKV